MTTYAGLAVRTLASCCDNCKLTGFRVGDRVIWTDPDNQCKWGKCTGVIMQGTDEYTDGHLVVFWDNGCTRHFDHKHTESDPITRKHVKISFHL